MRAAFIDQTHASGRRSWVEEANGHSEFPIQNLPFGIFSVDSGRPRGGVAIGDHVLDLEGVHGSGLLEGAAQQACGLCTMGTLNDFLAAGQPMRQALRMALGALLAEGAPVRPALLNRAASCRMHMPVRVGDYTDFYAGIHHATNTGRLFRKDAPLLPNYKHVPIGYHGRASSLRVSGVDVVRPQGQTKRADEEHPVFGATRRLDYELELGIWVGQANALGEAVPVGRAAHHIAGFCLLNDWSARDMQAWEYQPLGPFLAKSFHTSVSPWIVTPEALAPYRATQAARAAGDPAPLPYLADPADQAAGALDLELEVLIETRAMREAGAAPRRLSIGNALNLYWTPAQLVAHHASNGCNLNPGDLIGTGTISSETPDGYGSLLEISEGGRDPVALGNGETRSFLEDGDAVILRAHARKTGFVTIGLGECRAMVTPAAVAVSSGATP